MALQVDVLEPDDVDVLEPDDVDVLPVSPAARTPVASPRKDGCESHRLPCVRASRHSLPLPHCTRQVHDVVVNIAPPSKRHIELGVLRPRSDLQHGVGWWPGGNGLVGRRVH